MLSNQEKLHEFSRSIERELAGQIARIDQDIEQYKKTQTQAIEEEISSDANRLIQKQTTKIHLEITTERSRMLSSLKKGLLLKRDEYVGLIFDDVRKMLLEFTAGSEYPDYFCEKLAAARDRYRLTRPRISVREADLALKGRIEKLFDGCTVSASEAITIGGFIMEEEGKSFIINESLESILEEQKEWFYSHSGLRITQF